MKRHSAGKSRKKKASSRKKTDFRYTRRHYESNNGMMTNVWGPSTWHLLHTLSFNYPLHPSAQEKRHYRSFILQLQDVLPCGKCRDNFKKNLATYPLRVSHMKSRNSFSRYIYHLHELVNTMLHKKSHLSYEDVRDRYEHFRARCSTLAPLSSSSSSKSEPLSPSQYKEDHHGDKKAENGCVEPMNGLMKTKCILRIVPEYHKCKHDFKCLV